LIISTKLINQDHQNQQEQEKPDTRQGKSQDAQDPTSDQTDTPRNLNHNLLLNPLQLGQEEESSSGKHLQHQVNQARPDGPTQLDDVCRKKQEHEENAGEGNKCTNPQTEKHLPSVGHGLLFDRINSNHALPVLQHPHQLPAGQRQYQSHHTQLEQIYDQCEAPKIHLTLEPRTECQVQYQIQYHHHAPNVATEEPNLTTFAQDLCQEQQQDKQGDRIHPPTRVTTPIYPFLAKGPRLGMPTQGAFNGTNRPIDELLPGLTRVALGNFFIIANDVVLLGFKRDNSRVFPDCHTLEHGDEFLDLPSPQVVVLGYSLLTEVLDTDQDDEPEQSSGDQTSRPLDGEVPEAALSFEGSRSQTFDTKCCHPPAEQNCHGEDGQDHFRPDPSPGVSQVESELSQPLLVVQIHDFPPSSLSSDSLACVSTKLYFNDQY